MTFSYDILGRPFCWWVKIKKDDRLVIIGKFIWEEGNPDGVPSVHIRWIGDLSKDEIRYIWHYLTCQLEIKEYIAFIQDRPEIEDIAKCSGFTFNGGHWVYKAYNNKESEYHGRPKSTETSTST